MSELKKELDSCIYGILFLPNRHYLYWCLYSCMDNHNLISVTLDDGRVMSKKDVLYRCMILSNFQMIYLSPFAKLMDEGEKIFIRGKEYDKYQLMYRRIKVNIYKNLHSTKLKELVEFMGETSVVIHKGKKINRDEVSKLKFEDFKY